MTNSSRAWVLAVVLAAGCGGDDEGLDPEEVTNVPPGDGKGEAASGMWSFEAYTSACSGKCSAAEGFVVFCEVGNRDSAEAMIVQDDGALQIDVDESFFVSRLKGGVDKDGSFDVGGYGTESGGALEITARVTGTFEGDDSTGVGEFRILGDSNGDFVDCQATYEITGMR